MEIARCRPARHGTAARGLCVEGLWSRDSRADALYSCSMWLVSRPIEVSIPCLGAVVEPAQPMHVDGPVASVSPQLMTASCTQGASVGIESQGNMETQSVKGSGIREADLGSS